MPSYSDGLGQFFDILPAVVRERLERTDSQSPLIEVVLDYGRPAEARYLHHVERLHDVIVSEHDIDFVTKSIGEFGTDNRAGIERTLHRISCIRNRHGKVIGLTCRVGRALEGTIDIIDDIVRSGASILMLGRPGVGKTTKLREVARVLADEVQKRVVIVDTSNEIAGDGDVPHPAIGSARRMPVRVAAEQHNVMIEAVENHMPEVIVIDEIGTDLEATAARTIAERGVQLVGTAHGQTLENLMLNPTLADLIGGIQAVTLSDAEAHRRGTQKTVLERKAPPTFDVVIELLDYDRLAVHHNVQKTVDMILRGQPPRPEVRVRTSTGEMEIVQNEETAELDVPGFNQKYPSLGRPQSEPSPKAAPRANAPVVDDGPSNLLRILPVGIARTRLDRAIREKRVPAVVTSDPASADVVLTIRNSQLAKPKKLRDITGRPMPTFYVKSNTFIQISEALDQMVRRDAGSGENERQALEEAQQGIESVLATGKALELSPASPGIRKAQHQLAEARRLATEAVGEEPNRRIRILPNRIA
ncbi:MAG: AAA family ATPase [Armatimonadetes bacterium]|nr:AAA family ATPase [Armatimonadota bacterium]